MVLYTWPEDVEKIENLRESIFTGIEQALYIGRDVQALYSRPRSSLWLLLPYSVGMIIGTTINFFPGDYKIGVLIDMASDVGRSPAYKYKTYFELHMYRPRTSHAYYEYEGWQADEVVNNLYMPALRYRYDARIQTIFGYIDLEFHASRFTITPTQSSSLI